MIGNNTIPFKDKELSGWRFINSGLKSKAQDGVGIALAPDVELIDIENILDGRILLIRCILHVIRISAITMPLLRCMLSPPKTIFSLN